MVAVLLPPNTVLNYSFYKIIVAEAVPRREKTCQLDFRPSKARKKANIRNQYNQVLTQDIVWKSDRNKTNRHIQESQEVSPFPAGDHKAARHRQDNMAKTNTN